MSSADNARRLTLPARINRFMLNEELTYTDAAKKLGVSRATLARFSKKAPEKHSKAFVQVSKFLNVWENENLYTKESEWKEILQAIKQVTNVEAHVAYAGSLALSLGHFIFHSFEPKIRTLPFQIKGEGCGERCAIGLRQDFVSGVFCHISLYMPYMNTPTYFFKIGSSKVPGYQGHTVRGHLTNRSVLDMRTRVVEDIIKQEI